ncbi:MAG TPA: hypothetical protein VFN13_03735 [Rudaea sp.]|nr:hypothetical protein [Rudaea sp.]
MQRSTIREDDCGIRLINSRCDINDALIPRDRRDLTERLSVLLIPDMAGYAGV